MPQFFTRKKLETVVAGGEQPTDRGRRPHYLPSSDKSPPYQGMPDSQGASRRLVPGFSALWGVVASPVGGEFADTSPGRLERRLGVEGGEKKWVKEGSCVPISTPRRPKL